MVKDQPQNNNTIFCFGIPLRSAETAKDWPFVESLFENTLVAALNQLGANVRVIVACHDVPRVPIISDPRVTIIKAQFPLPANPREQLRDKGWKKNLITIEFRRQGGGYLMWLDADDLVSNRLASYAISSNNKFGYYIDKGYSLCGITDRLRRIRRNFSKVCGSCTIIRLGIEDLPEKFDPNGSAYSGGFKEHGNHRLVAEKAGRPLSPIPFPAVIYKINTGENHSAHIGKKKGIARNPNLQILEVIINKIFRRMPSKSIKKEFSIN